MCRTLLGAASIAVALTMTTSQLAQAGAIRIQKPCSVRGNACVTFESVQQIVVRSFTFKAPVGSQALLTFNGSMSCSEVNSGPSVLDIASQIVAAEGAVARETGPGGLRHRAFMDGFGETTSFNLASSRGLRIKDGGETIVHFKLNVREISDFTTCSVENAAFTVVLLP